MSALATGSGRRTDAGDAHSVALVGLRIGGLRQVTTDDERGALKLLVDRRAMSWCGLAPRSPTGCICCSAS